MCLWPLSDTPMAEVRKQTFAVWRQLVVEVERRDSRFLLASKAVVNRNKIRELSLA